MKAMAETLGVPRQHAKGLRRDPTRP